MDQHQADVKPQECVGLQLLPLPIPKSRRALLQQNQTLPRRSHALRQNARRNYALDKVRLAAHTAIPARTINWIDRQTSNLEAAGSNPAVPAIWDKKSPGRNLYYLARIST
jgi:hypothetical protein